MLKLFSAVFYSKVKLSFYFPGRICSMRKSFVLLMTFFLIVGLLFVNQTFAAGPNNSSGKVVPSITIVSPNSGEVWMIGRSYKIKWSATGVAKDSKVNIDLIDDSLLLANPMERALKGIVHGISAKNSYTWSPTYDFLTQQGGFYFSPGDNFRLKITEVKSNGTYGVQGESYSYFTVQIRTTVSISVPPCKEISLELYDLELVSFRVDRKNIRGLSVKFRNPQPREVRLEVLGDGAVLLTTDTGWQWIAIIWGGNIIPFPPLPSIPGDDLGGDPPPPPPSDG